MSADYTLEELKIIFSGEQFRSKNLVSLASALYVEEIEAASLGPTPEETKKKKRKSRKKKGENEKPKSHSKKSDCQSGENQASRKHSTNSNQSSSNVCFDLANEDESLNTSEEVVKNKKTKNKMKRNSESQADESMSKNANQKYMRQKHKSINVPDVQASLEDNLGEIDKNNFRSNYNLQSLNNHAKPIKSSASSVCVNASKKHKNIFEPYLSAKLIEEGLANKTLIQGKLRINPRNYEDAFVSDPNGGGDYYINGLVERNRALNGDIVVIQVKEKYLWKILDSCKEEVIKVIKKFDSEKNLSEELKELMKLNETMENAKKNDKKPANKSNNGTQNGNKMQNDRVDLVDLAMMSFNDTELLQSLNDNWFQKTAKVVGVMDKKNSRWTVGHLKLFSDMNKDWAIFSPNDSRIPRIRVKMNECPPDFYSNPQFYAKTLFVAKIVDSPLNSKYALGKLKRSIGIEGDIEVETEGILIENGIDFADFSDEVVRCLPKTPWRIPDSEFTYRRDLRSHCIFTIDPATARDLDDALHCIKLDDDLYEVGVHIADVAYFIPENSALDKCASERATSVYLVQKVIPMLPRLLCEELCSLNPSTDRLAFSVIWKIRSNGEIVDEWFGRTIINSAVKLSYDHAQKFIENPNEDFKLEEFPEIRKEFNLRKIRDSVLHLHSIAKELRAKRYEKGCLTLNQVKISFVLNKELGLPYGYNVYEQKDSNKLVEEFMLLANIAVAHRIYKFYPEKAILRRHPMPNVKQLEQLAESLKHSGFNCDITGSNTIQAFLNSVEKTNLVASITLTCMLTKTMQLAQYFCSGMAKDKEFFYHYGLAVPLYTHFTSPIRRYPDILVHRLLAATLNYNEVTPREANLLQSISENCNDKKYSARICSERSSELFFSIFVNECGPFEEVACVTQIRDHSFDVLILNLGISKRIYCDRLNIDQESIEYVKNILRPEISFTWLPTAQFPTPTRQKIEIFSTLNVILNKHESDKLKFNVVVKHPNEKVIFNNEVKQKIMSSLTDMNQLYDQNVDVDPYICD